MKPKDLFERIATECSSFRAVLADHLDDSPELLPHFLMGNLRRYIGSGLGGERYLEFQPPSRDDVSRILALLEQAFSAGDEDTVNVISVSFLEYIESELYFAELEPMLGPLLRAEHDRQVDWYSHAR